MTILASVSLTDRIQVPSARHLTDSGQMIVPCAFARTGAQNYTAGQLGLTDTASDKVVTVMRDEADVFDSASLSSFRSVPVTIGHPKTEQGLPQAVTAKNAAKLQVGVLEGMPVRDEDTLTGTLVIARQDAIDLIEDGTKELSAGYTCDLEVIDGAGGESIIYQRNIRANHIAIVERGRAGAMCSIADEDTMDVIKTEEEVVLSDDQASNEAVAVEDTVVSETVSAEAGVEAAVEDAVADVEVEVASAAVETEDEVAEPILLDEEVKEVVVEVADEVAAEINLEDELETVKTSMVALTDELSEANAKVAALQDQLENSVNERVETILIAKDLTDMNEFSAKSVQEIKLEVVAKLMPNLTLDGKSEAYVCARFDILSEDAEIGETPMGRLLSDNAVAVHKVAQPSTKVADARARATERHIARK
jgi:hypothetical protein